MPRAKQEPADLRRIRLQNDIRKIRWRRAANGRDPVAANSETLSRELGLGANKINEYENGVHEPSVTVAIRLARRLGVTVEDLYAPFVDRLQNPQYKGQMGKHG